MTRVVDFNKAFVTGNIDHILLSELSEKPNHGYGLISLIKEEHRVYLGPSTIYPSLNWLEKKGLVRSHWDLDNGRPRKVYLLTDKGKRTVRHQRMRIRQILTKMVESKC